MSIGIQVNISQPGLTVIATRIRDRRGFLQVAGRGARRATIDHLRAYNRANPNRLGGRRTNFYSKAADAVNVRLVGDEAVVLSINQLGLALRVFGTGGLPGGVLKPKAKRFLTIPAAPEAHGKRAGEFSDLEFGFAYDPEIGRMRAALVRPATSLTTLFRNRRRSAARAPIIGPGTAESSGEPVFWLVRQVRQKGDRNVLPSDAAFNQAAQDAAAEWLSILLER